MVRDVTKAIRAAEERCKFAASDSPDEELSEYLREVAIVLNSIASVLSQEYDQ